MDDSNEERRHAELDFVEAAYDPKEAWCTRGEVPCVHFRIKTQQLTRILFISLSKGYPERELLEITCEETLTGDADSRTQQLLQVCRQTAAACPGEEAIFAVLSAAQEWMQAAEEDVSSSSIVLQKVACHSFSTKHWDLYRCFRTPSSLTALIAQLSTGMHVFGIDDRSLFLKGNTTYDPEQRTWLQSQFSSQLVFRFIWLDNDHRHEAPIEVWGTCHEAVAETTSWLFSLPDHQKHIVSMVAYSNSVFSFEFHFSDLLSALLSHHPFRQVRFGGIDFSQEHSAVLATQEHAVNIVLAHCWLAGGGSTFFECMQQRTTPFGSLTLESVHPFSEEVFTQLVLRAPLSKLCLVNLALRNAWLPFRARANHVEMTNCIVEEDYGDSTENVFIIRPKAFVLGFDPIRSSIHYHPLLDASHGLNKLGIHFYGTPTTEQVQALLSALENNQQLKVLELGHDILCFKDHWDELMAVLRKSRTIGKLRLHVRNSPPDAAMLLSLKQLLEDRRDMDVVFPMGDWPLVPTTASQWEAEVRLLLEFNRWYFGVLQLQSVESILKRDALFGRALWHRREFRFVSFLLASNLDVLLSLMGN
ncbi:hypothetical protein FisN_8Hh047 [Fistulifera solaris]|jgi:hypothetical protein|uniref:RWD domain-containing protein n=1 Tax=Fistulifera solaris TaxID=1519565 RepID=A0A1Z5JJD0_FISSO|nr:hypothetical protein FisN_8Hh047 [Fistulifera solaris]|eukprot:GAX14117.1 hypothetical protein FisN_8Hh047 [Fistulifera solaris]